MVVDRRDTQVVMSKPDLLELTMDVDSMAAEAFRRMEEAHFQALGHGDPTLIHFISSAAYKVREIGRRAREASGAIERAEVWTRPDGAVVTADIAAA